MTISIYSMDGQKVYEMTETKMCPGSYSFTWDGSVNVWDYGYPPEEGWSNIADAGLYTFDVEVIGPAYYYDADWVRSKALTVVPGPVEYYGYDDGGTPDDETDDSHFYYIRWYALYSGRNSSYGEIWLYDPDFERVYAWAVLMLTCVVHGGNDGLVANPNGEVHGVIIPVPVSVMEKEGTYRFVLHFYDDYADSYKNHKVKAALEVNSIPETFEFTVSTDPQGDSPDGHPGHKEGERDTTKFYVIIEATCAKKPNFETIAFRLERPKTKDGRTKTGYLVGEKIDEKSGKKVWVFRTHETLNDKGKTDWIVTKMKGRWKISVNVPGSKSNTVWFKINKREQIVIVANSWVGATSQDLGSPMCNRFTARVYHHVGFSQLPEGLQDQYYSTKADNGQGCLVFYSMTKFPDASHVGIQDGINIVDINCLLSNVIEVHKHLQSALHKLYPGGQEKRTFQEVKDLDSE